MQVKSGHANSKKPADSLKGRFTGVSIFSVAVFGTLAAKLWSMQILSSEDYANKAASNLYTTVSTPAPRGYIYDADGIALVKNRSSQTVLADADVVDDHDVVARLSAVLGIPQAIVRQRIQSTTAGAQSQRVVASDVRLRDVAFIAEHSDAFSGVTVETRTVRDYPFGALCAHALGYTGTPSEDQVSNAPSNRDIQLTDDVGKSGIESAYDNLLAGDHGQRVVTVDAQGNVVDVVSETKATRGSDVYLTIKGRSNTPPTRRSRALSRLVTVLSVQGRASVVRSWPWTCATAASSRCRAIPRSTRRTGSEVFPPRRTTSTTPIPRTRRCKTA